MRTFHNIASTAPTNNQPAMRFDCKHPSKFFESFPKIITKFSVKFNIFNPDNEIQEEFQKYPD